MYTTDTVLPGTKVLVTGGAGFIGSHLVQRLVAEGADVTVLDNFSRGHRENLSSVQNRIQLIEGDARDRMCVELAVRGRTVVFHLAAQSSVSRASLDLDESFSCNVAGTFEVLRAAQQSGVSHFVFASSREVYGDPLSLPVSEDAPLNPKNAYGVSKLAGELYCRAFAQPSFHVAVLRLANVYGPGDTGRVIPLFVAQALNNCDLMLHGGGQVLDFVWIDPVIDAFIAATLPPCAGCVVNVGSGRGVTIRDLASRIIRLARSGAAIRIMPSRPVESVCFIADMTRAEQLLGIHRTPEPLDKLSFLLASLRAATEAADHNVNQYSWAEHISR